MRLWGIQHYDLWTMFNLLICFVYYKYSAFLVLILQLKCTMLVGLESGERVLWPLADGNWGLMGGLGGWMRTRMGKRWTCRKDYKVIILSGGSLSMIGKLWTSSFCWTGRITGSHSEAIWMVGRILLAVFIVLSSSVFISHPSETETIQRHSYSDQGREVAWAGFRVFNSKAITLFSKPCS